MQNICESTKSAQEARQHVQVLSMSESLDMAYRQDEESKKTPDKRASKTKQSKKKIVKKVRAQALKKKAEASSEPITASSTDVNKGEISHDSDFDVSESESEEQAGDEIAESSADQGELDFDDNNVNEEKQEADEKEKETNRLMEELRDYNESQFDTMRLRRFVLSQTADETESSRFFLTRELLLEGSGLSKVGYDRMIMALGHQAVPFNHFVTNVTQDLLRSEEVINSLKEDVRDAQEQLNRGNADPTTKGSEMIYDDQALMDALAVNKGLELQLLQLRLENDSLRKALNERKRKADEAKTNANAAAISQTSIIASAIAPPSTMGTSQLVNLTNQATTKAPSYRELVARTPVSRRTMLGVNIGSPIMATMQPQLGGNNNDSSSSSAIPSQFTDAYRNLYTSNPASIMTTSVTANADNDDSFSNVS